MTSEKIWTHCYPEKAFFRHLAILFQKNEQTIMMKKSLVFSICFPVLCGIAAAQVEDQYFDSEGVQIRYTVQGEGEPVVLIH